MGKMLLGFFVVVSLFFLPQVDAKGAPAMESFVFGTVRVTALQDMPGEMDLSIFQGADESVMKAFAPSGSVPAGIMVFLVQSGGVNVLVDTGYGMNSAERASALPALLERNGLKPESIDFVLLTHLHGDHIGGLVRNGEAFFPKAGIFVGEKELEFWTDPATREAKPTLGGNMDMVAAMQKAYGGKVKTFAFDDTVMPGITALAATGHTPGHTAFLLASGNNKLLFWGDLVHGAALQFPNPDICAKYDMDMPEAVKTRRKLFEQAATEGLPVAGAHLPFPALGKVSNAGNNGYVFHPGIQ